MKRFVILSGLVLFILFSLFWSSLPDPSLLKKRNPGKTSFMEFREKEWKDAGKQEKIQQEWVPLVRVSPFLIKGLIIAEDAKFWTHEGFDYDAIEAALEKDLKSKKFKKGGSTLSQQLAKNLYLTPEKSLFRKIKEAAITWRLERNLTKKRILEIYLNVVEWGDGIFGIESASRVYFGKHASELDPIEACRLVSVLPNPRKYHPDGNQRYVLRRSEAIFNLMVRKGIVVREYEEMKEGSEEPAPDHPLSLSPATSLPFSAISGSGPDVPAR